MSESVTRRQESIAGTDAEPPTNHIVRDLTASSIGHALLRDDVGELADWPTYNQALAAIRGGEVRVV